MPHEWVVPRFSQSRRLSWIILGATAVSLLLFAGAVYLDARNDPNPLVAVHSYDYDPTVEASPTYLVEPPVGGAYTAEALPCGTYDQPVPNEKAVHSLAQGAIWITYRPDLPADQVNALRALLNGDAEVILSPYPGLPDPIVLTAWNRQLGLESVDDERLPLFINTYRNNPDVAPDVGAVCPGTVTTSPIVLP